MGIGRGRVPNIWDTGDPPVFGRAWLVPRSTPFPHVCCYSAECGCSISDGTSVITEIGQKLPLAFRLSMSLKVTETDTDRDQRPVTHNCFRNKHPYVFKGFPLELGNTRSPLEARMTGMPGQEDFLAISSTVWIQYTNVTDRRTDTGRRLGPRLRKATRGKN